MEGYIAVLNIPVSTIKIKKELPPRRHGNRFGLLSSEKNSTGKFQHINKK